MLFFTPVGLSSNTVEQAITMRNELAQSSSTTTASVTILPKEVTKEESAPKPKKVEAPVSVAQAVRTYFSSTPVLAEIARCESTNRQYDVTGNVLRGKVNKSDVGVMQINEKFHSSRAKALGLNLYSLQGNMAYAKLLYKEQGTSPWISSSGCWGSPVPTAY